MGRRAERGAHDSDAAATRWTKIVFWAILLGCAAALVYYLSTALWRLFGSIYRAYSAETGLIWPLR